VRNSLLGRIEQELEEKNWEIGECRRVEVRLKREGGRIIPFRGRAVRGERTRSGGTAAADVESSSGSGG